MRAESRMAILAVLFIDERVLKDRSSGFKSTPKRFVVRAPDGPNRRFRGLNRPFEVIYMIRNRST